jgi:hypothetical protein
MRETLFEAEIWPRKLCNRSGYSWDCGVRSAFRLLSR